MNYSYHFPSGSELSYLSSFWGPLYSFGKSVTNQYEPTLNRLLPQNVEKRLAYLPVIIDETKAGKEFLMKIARAVIKKYKGRPGMIPAYRGLLDTAKAMQKSMA
ncbi:MAG: hypothetical protein F6K19_49955 [Cyanothece sp. SIO1E1]|nr:hypothetical protein [Cyanothece sp. SIO1E1]